MLIWQKFKFGIFDVDGTLFDNMALCADAFLEIIKNFNFQETPEEMRKIYLATNGMNLNDQFKLFFDKYGINPYTYLPQSNPYVKKNVLGVRVKYDEALIKKLNKKFFDLRDNWKEWQNAPLFPGVEKLLEKLNAKNIAFFISSGSNGDEISRRLKNSGILKYFDSVLGGEKIPKGALHIEEFAEKCGLPAQKFASHAFFVSDGPNDMAIAKKTGIFAIGITNTVSPAKLKSAGADIVISGIEQLNNFEF